jgi:oligopeptide/dipeptide ABC transporter ATP-binding protein
MTMDRDLLLDVRGLITHIYTRRGVVRAVNGVSFSLRRGEVLGLVGESGSGKSLTCFSLVRVLPPGARIVAGQVLFEGEDLATIDQEQMRAHRGAAIGMILQDPLASLDPLIQTGAQVAEPLRFHRPAGTADAGGETGARAIRQRVLDLFRLLRIPDPVRRMKSYPHQMSGGMKQRVVGAIALAAGPRLLIADEPTTALDVTVQAQILRLLKDLQERSRMSLILVTHDLGVAAEVCDRIAVMYGGRIVEIGTTREIFSNPRHHYTHGLLRSLPRMGEQQSRLPSIEGQPPDPLDLPPGCPFVPRCPAAVDECSREFPPAATAGDGHTVHCWNPIPVSEATATR